MWRREFFLSVVGSASLLAILATGTQTFAQGGNVGGVIGKQNKTVVDDTPRPVKRAPPPRKRSNIKPGPTGDSPAVTKLSCNKIVGAWSWGPAVGTVTFKANGTASVSNGDSGKWTCNAGQYTIKWTYFSNTTTGTLTADGNQFAGKGILGSFVANRK